MMNQKYEQCCLFLLRFSSDHSSRWSRGIPTISPEREGSEMQNEKKKTTEDEKVEAMGEEWPDDTPIKVTYDLGDDEE